MLCPQSLQKQASGVKLFEVTVTLKLGYSFLWEHADLVPTGRSIFFYFQYDTAKTLSFPVLSPSKILLISRAHPPLTGAEDSDRATDKPVVAVQMSFAMPTCVGVVLGLLCCDGQIMSFVRRCVLGLLMSCCAIKGITQSLPAMSGIMVRKRL
jgi:hypothetical protein